MITSTSNQQMKQIAQLMKKAKARNEQGVFVAEGKKMFLEAPEELLRQVYISETCYRSLTQGVQGEREQKLRERLEQTGYEVVSDAVFRSVADTQTPQGVLCIVQKPVYGLSDLLRGERSHLLVLESIQDPGNLGTMIRTGEGAGLTGVVMNGTTVDFFNPKTIRSTMGSVYRVPFLVTENLAETIMELRKHGIRIFAAHLKGQKAYDEPDYRGATAFLIGNEGNGLSEEIAALSDTYIKIPMEGRVESLNAAVSAALLMYEANRQRRKREEA